jgi:hypothetical protein
MLVGKWFILCMYLTYRVAILRIVGSCSIVFGSLVGNWKYDSVIWQLWSVEIKQTAHN